MNRERQSRCGWWSDRAGVGLIVRLITVSEEGVVVFVEGEGVVVVVVVQCMYAKPLGEALEVVEAVEGLLREVLAIALRLPYKVLGEVGAHRLSRERVARPRPAGTL